MCLAASASPDLGPGRQLLEQDEQDDAVARMANMAIPDAAAPVEYPYGYQAQAGKSYQPFAIPTQPAYPVYMRPSPAYTHSPMRTHRPSAPPNSGSMVGDNGMFYQQHLPPELYMDAGHGGPGYPQSMHPQSSRTSPVESPSGYMPPPPGFAHPHMMLPPEWGSPMMSPVMPAQAVNMGSLGSMGRGGHVRPQAYIDEFGAHRAVYPGANPGATWASASSPTSYTFYTPYQQQAATFDRLPGSEGWSASTSPVLSQAAFPHRQSWQGHVAPNPRANRMSWSGPSRGPPPLASQTDKAKERRPYHPQPPARRSDYVMWVGNVYVL